MQNVKQKLNKFSLTCSCGKYNAELDFESIAESAARMHVMLGPEHKVICTRPAHFHPGGVPVIMFTVIHGAVVWG